MRLLSFNIHNRMKESSSLMKERMGDIASLVKSLHPDVVALQEVTPEAWEYLRKELNITEAEYCPREDGKEKGEGVPVFPLGSGCTITQQHSFWLSDTPDHPSRMQGAIHPRVCSAIRIAKGADAWWVFNIHLDHRSPGVRRRSLDLLRTQIEALTEGEDPRLICGDFNMPGYRKILQQFCQSEPKWEDATQYHPVAALRPTYLGWGPFRLAKARIDLCLHTSGLRVGEYHAVNPCWQGRQLSDHRAIVVDLEDKSFLSFLLEG
ncbi:endonuclease/exonuclease/phosphatase family protein [Kiritimatiellota bacterium B12222]|nr:endonuclease/exonuclease/phosphatase family protein [Kiritimatiellota bacterium B12222]